MNGKHWIKEKAANSGESKHNFAFPHKVLKQDNLLF